MCIKNARKVDWNIKHAYKVIANSSKGLITPVYAMPLKETDEWQYPSNERLYPYPNFRRHHTYVAPESYFGKRKQKNKITVLIDVDQSIRICNKVWRQCNFYFGASSELWKVEVGYDQLIVGEDSNDGSSIALVDKIRLLQCIYPEKKARNLVTEINNETVTEVESIPVEEKKQILLFEE